MRRPAHTDHGLDLLAPARQETLVFGAFPFGVTTPTRRTAAGYTAWSVAGDAETTVLPRPSVAEGVADAMLRVAEKAGVEPAIALAPHQEVTVSVLRDNTPGPARFRDVCGALIQVTYGMRRCMLPPRHRHTCLPVPPSRGIAVR